MQLQSVQCYQNKAVPSAALLFVYLERANALPVSLLCNLPKSKHSSGTLEKKLAWAHSSVLHNIILP